MNDLMFYLRIKRNFILLVEILLKYPIWTVSLLSVFVISNGYYLFFEYGMGGIDVAFSVLACVFVIAFFKISFFLVFYDFFFVKPFNGSLWFLSMFNSVLFVLAVLFLSIVIDNHVDDFPFSQLKWILLMLAVVLFLITLGGSVFIHRVIQQSSNR